MIWMTTAGRCVPVSRRHQSTVDAADGLGASSDATVGDGVYETVDGAMFDADHDGDLDVFCVNSGPLINNNRNGPLHGSVTMSSQREVTVRSRCWSSISIGIGTLIWLRSGQAEITSTSMIGCGVGGRLGPIRFDSHRIINAMVAGDVEATGRAMLCTAGPDGLSWWREREGSGCRITSSGGRWRPVRDWPASISPAMDPLISLPEPAGGWSVWSVGGGSHWSR